MLGFIFKTFIGLISAFTTITFGESLDFNSEECIKFLSLNN